MSLGVFFIFFKKVLNNLRQGAIIIGEGHPETIADEYELKGVQYACSECPMFRPSNDKRIKYTTCAHGTPRCAANDYACDWFYEQLEKGGIQLLCGND